MKNRKKVLIIGGGVAGMTAAIYAAEAGFSCDIFEKQASPGGNLTGWKRDGYTIDNCMHWLTGTHPQSSLYTLWQKTGMLREEISLHREEHLYESEWEGKRLALDASPEKTRRKMWALSPADHREIDRLIDTVLAVIPWMTGGTIPEKAKLIPHLPDLLFYRRTDLYTLADRFRHPLLRLLMTDYIGGEYSAAALIAAYAAFASGNGSLPAGGSPAAAERMRQTCLQKGCRFYTGVPVRRIVVRNGIATGILTADGAFFPADELIAACDPQVTFGKLLPAEWMPEAMKERLKNPDIPAFSSLHAAFSCDRAAIRPFGTRIIPAPYFSSRSGGRLPVREYSSEPSFAPPGKTILQTLVFQTREESLEWISLSGDPSLYRARKEAVGEEMRRAIARHFPEASPSLRLLDVWTPATYRGYFGNPCGAYLSFAMTPHTPLSRLPRHTPHVRNLVLATQWLTSPGGLPSAALAGKQAAEELAEEHSLIPTENPVGGLPTFPQNAG